MEDYDPEYYDAFERAVAAEIAQDEATIGEVDTSLRLNPCDDCPMMKFPMEEVIGEMNGFSATLGVQGLAVTTRFKSKDGKFSKDIVLGRHNSNSIGGKRTQKIYADAAQRTIECEGPKKVPKFLGPLALKRCPALERG